MVSYFIFSFFIQLFTLVFFIIVPVQFTNLFIAFIYNERCYLRTQFYNDNSILFFQIRQQFHSGKVVKLSFFQVYAGSLTFSFFTIEIEEETTSPIFAAQVSNQTEENLYIFTFLKGKWHAHAHSESPSSAELQSDGWKSKSNKIGILWRRVQTSIHFHPPLFLPGQLSLSLSLNSFCHFNLTLVSWWILEKNDDGRPTLVLDSTIFHPQGGGQPSDKGSVSSAHFNFIVEDVRSKGKIVCLSPNFLL